MTSSVPSVGATLENVKRKLDGTMDEPMMAKKSKTKENSMPMDVVQTDDDDDDNEEDGDGDRTDDGENDSTSLTSNNNRSEIKNHMVEAIPETTTATPTVATTTRDFLLDERSDQIECPLYGQIVNRREFRRAGQYLIGLKLGHSPVDSIVQYLAKKENTNEFYQLKILVLNNSTSNEKLLQDERQGKMLLHTEFSLLSLLENEDGIMQQHGLFSVSIIYRCQTQIRMRSNFFPFSMRLSLSCRIWHMKKCLPKILRIIIFSLVDYENVWF